MNTETFCYWLQGFVELCPEQQPSAAQWKMIQDHLQLVFKKETKPLQINVQPTPMPSLPKFPAPEHWQYPNQQPVVMC